MLNFTQSKIKKPQRETSGFTLIELMVTVSIFSLLILVAAPNFSGIMQNNRLSVVNNDLVTALSLSRSEAIKRQQTVTICSSSDGVSCDNSQWREGWIVFTDKNSNASFDGTDQYLLVHGKVSFGVTISSLSDTVKYGPVGQRVASCTSNCVDDLGAGGSTIALIPTELEKFVMRLLPISSAYAGDDGHSGTSGNSGSSNLPTCTAPSSGSSGSNSSGSSGSSSSGSSGSSSSGSSVATCNGGGLVGPITSNQMLICDSGRSGEKGSLITVSKIGHISRRSVICN